MKRFFLLIFSATLIATMLPSCKASLPGRFESFVSSVEKHSSSYSQDDWTKANDKFEQLFDEYTENRTSYNSEEKKEINSAIARYAKAAAKSGIDEITNSISEITSQIPALIEGAKSFLQELGLTGSDE